MCILDPQTSPYTDCVHDMNSVGSLCYRCPRYYGNTMNQACFACYPNCLQCTGQNFDECTYCGMGYGFTGISCNQCPQNQAWDLSTNLCQISKVAYLEMDYDINSFGQVQLLFVPLQGYADLSLYYEYIYGKYWLIDINFNYQFSRTYSSLPLHRKVSISFELISIDTYHYQSIDWAVDLVYLRHLFFNLEDADTNCTVGNSFWGYGYQDMQPTKFVHTIFHSAPSMMFSLAPFFGPDWATVWIRELNVTFFGCFPSCSACWVDNSPVSCTACLPGYYLSNFQCLSCSSACATCSGTATQCTSCPTNQVLLTGTCLQSCGLNFYVDVLGNCQPCPATCIQCTSATNCITCHTGNYLDVTNMCSPCTPPCATCSGTATTCYSCTGILLLKNNACVAGPCGAGYYQVGATCPACLTGCATCTASACTSCSMGYMQQGTICVSTCSLGFYPSSATLCSPCLSTCLSCTTGTSCTACKPGFVGATCTACTSPCMTCSGTATNCQSCLPSTNTYLQVGGGTCVAANACQAGSYAETNNQCMPCSSNCGTCVTFPYNCLSCSNPLLIWSNFQCIASCASGYSSIGGLCCPSTCTGCNQSMACSGCIAGYYLDASSSCQICDSNCLTCSVLATNCTSCSGGLVLQTGVCQQYCNLGFYNNGGICQACDASCANCTGPSATQCTVCSNLYIMWNGLCYNCMNNQTNFATSRFQTIGGRCWEKCGIGKRLTINDISTGLGGYKACDDGNLVNGDGCSASCTVESNYNCVNGGLTTADYCYSLVKPYAIIVPINNSTDFQIIFSEKISFRDPADATNNTANVTFPISLNITNFDSSLYTVTWYAPKAVQFDYVNFSIAAKKSMVNAKVVVTFNRPVIVDGVNNTLTNVYIKLNTTIYVQTKFVLEPVFNGITMTNHAGNILVPVASLGITNYVLQCFTRFMTSTQLIGAGIFMNVVQTSQMDSLLTDASTLSSSSLPGPGSLMKNKLVVASNASTLDPRIKTWFRRVLQLNTSYVNRNVSGYADLYNTSDSALPFRRNGKTVSIIPNLSFSFAVLFITGIWYFFANFFALGKVTVKDSFAKRFFAFNAERALYSAMMFAALELSIFSTYNIMNPRFNHIANILSFVFALLAFFVTLALPLILFKISNHYVTTLWHPEYYERFGFIYCEFKLNNKVSKNFMSIIMLRIIVFGIFLAALVNYPIPQTVVTFIVHVIYYVVLLRTKPFVSMMIFWLTVAAEFFIICSSLCYIVSAYDNAKNVLQPISKKETLDQINCCFIIVAVFLLLIALIIMITLKIIQCIKRYQSKKQLQAISPAQSQQPAKQEKKVLIGEKPEELEGEKKLEDPKPAEDLPKKDDQNGGNKLMNQADEDDFLANAGGAIQNRANKDDWEEDFLRNNGNRQENEIDDKAF